MRKMMLALVALLSVAGVGWADDRAIIKELGTAGVRFGRLDSPLFPAPRCAFFTGMSGTNNLLDRFADLKRVKDLTVDLFKSDVTDQGLAILGCRVKELRGLYLWQTAITDKGLMHLRGMSLEELNLEGCEGVTDASVESLTRVRGLNQLRLSGTRVTEEGLARIQKALPKCEIFR